MEGRKLMVARTTDLSSQEVAITTKPIDSSSQEVTITTNRLKLYSLNQRNIFQQICDYRALFSKPENMALFRDGKPWNIKMVVKYLDTQNAKWDEGDVLSTFSVHDKNSGSYIGTLNIYYRANEYEKTGGGHSNVVEIGYIVDKPNWGKGFGTELALVARKYIECLILDRLKDKNQSRPIPDEIVATAHPDNKASLRILQRVLGKKEDTILKKFADQPRVMFFRPLKGPLDKIADVSEASVEKASMGA